MAKKLENMSDDEFMENWTAAADRLETAKATVAEYAAEHQRREEEAKAREKFEAMSDGERAALAQVFEVEGIETQEAVSNG